MVLFRNQRKMAPGSSAVNTSRELRGESKKRGREKNRRICQRKESQREDRGRERDTADR